MKEVNTVDYKELATVQCLEGLEQAKSLEHLDAITLYQCGIEQCKPNYSSGKLVKNTYVIYVILSGSGSYRVGKKDYILKAGDAFLVKPDRECIYKADEEDPWKYVWVGFAGYSARAVLMEMGFTEDCYVIHTRAGECIRDHVAGILASRVLNSANEMRRKSHLYAILSCLMEGNEKTEKSPRDTASDDLRKMYVRRAVDYMMDSYNKKIRISDIADVIGLNRSYFTNIFKKEMNMSPQDYLISLRLEKAAKLLQETNQSVRMVAFNTGYEDSLSFSKAFKQRYHMTPSEYRNKPVQLKEEFG